ncbi:MAG: putative acyl-CoA synthetase domain [Actinomycetota bacterium]
MSDSTDLSIERRSNLARMLSPRSVAVVGANEQLGMSNNAIIPMLEAGHEVALVNPRRDTLYGLPVFPDLSSIGRPIDSVLSLVNAERSLDVVDEAAAMGCGGVVVSAAGFLEAGSEGLALQERLLRLAERSGLAIVGPNCAGFKNVPLAVNLFTGGRLELPVSGVHTVGGVSIVSQSGFLVRSALAAAGERALGVSIAVSSGNEAVCDLADYVAVLTLDPATSVICLVIETVRRPNEFFAAVAMARAAGKPVIALKLGRSERARRIMQSHTGAIADESWVYDLAFREHGVLPAADIDDLLDRAQLFVQRPGASLMPIRRIGMITTSGGVAALATDLADDVGAPLPPLPEIEAWVRERVPGDTVNPLDLTGFVMTKPELMEEVFERYAEVVDALVLGWWTGDQDAGWSQTLLHPFANVAGRSAIPFIVSPVEATGIGEWVAPWRDRRLLFTRGVQSLYRAVDAVARFADPVRASVEVAAMGSGLPPATVTSDVGPMVRFADAMSLLVEHGISVAPWVVLSPGVSPDLAHLGPLVVVKLADVPHRTELGAVRVGVALSDVAAVAAELREIAAAHGVDDSVVVQAMITGHDEAFAGLQCRTGLGPVVLFGLGGVLVEVLGRVGGRFLPLDDASAGALANEVAGADVIGRLRGRRAWPLDAVADALLGLDRLWREHGHWLEAVDINPLIITDQGIVAVDALMIART